MTLRYAHASHAVMNGESLHVAGRLLGHQRVTTTNRYVHLDDATLSQAAERVATAVELKLHRTVNPCIVSGTNHKGGFPVSRASAHDTSDQSNSKATRTIFTGSPRRGWNLQ